MWIYLVRYLRCKFEFLCIQVYYFYISLFKDTFKIGLYMYFYFRSY